MPFIYHPDEPVNVTVVQGMLQHGTLNPHSFNYPSLFYYLHLPGQLLIQAIRGELHPVVLESVGNGYTAQPEVFLVGRVITACIGIGVVVCSMVLAREIGVSDPVILLVAALAAFNPLLARHSRMITPDVPAALFSTLALIGAVRVLKGMNSGYVFGGIMTGLAASSKYNAGLVGLSIAAGHFQYSRFTINRLGLLVMSGLISVAAFLLSSPFVILDFPHASQGVLAEIRHYATGHTGFQGDAWKFNLMWLGAIFGPALILAFLSALHPARTRNLPVVIFVVCYFLLISVQVVRFERNLMPIIPASIVLIGSGFDALVGIVQRRAKQVGGTSSLLALLGCVLVVPGAVQSLSDVAFRYRDLRADARAWISQHITPGASMLMDSYTPYADPKTFKVTGVDFVLQYPVSMIGSYVVVVVSRQGSGRFLNDSQSAESRKLDDIGRIACERKEFKNETGVTDFWLFKFRC
jgi:4-amino-4-deoxy-L-arabinose transferase-like glycosyltransferase